VGAYTETKLMPLMSSNPTIHLSEESISRVMCRIALEAEGSLSGSIENSSELRG